MLSADALLSTGDGLLGFNMYAYCLNNPVNMYDPDGDCSHVLLDKWDCAACKAAAKMVEKTLKAQAEVAAGVVGPQPAPTPSSSSATAASKSTQCNDDTPILMLYHKNNARPSTWNTHTNTRSGDKGDANRKFPRKPPKKTKKQRAKGQPNKSAWEPVLGVGLVVGCGILIFIIIADDATGIGVLDDPLLVPLGAGFTKGLTMIAGG